MWVIFRLENYRRLLLFSDVSAFLNRRSAPRVATHLLYRPHPHWTRRQKRSKTGCANPVVRTVLYILHAKQQATQHHVHKWDLVPFIRVASCVASSVDGASVKYAKPTPIPRGQRPKISIGLRIIWECGLSPPLGLSGRYLYAKPTRMPKVQTGLDAISGHQPSALCSVGLWPFKTQTLRKKNWLLDPLSGPGA